MSDDDLPVFSLWVQKLFGSSRFAALSGHAQGAYVLLLCREHGFRGRGLPSDDASLARLAGLDMADWQTVKEDVLQFFESMSGRLFNETCEEGIREALESKARVSQQRRGAANERWRQEREDAARNAAAYATALRLQCPPSPSPSDGKPPPTPSAQPPPDGELSAERPSACGEVFFSLTEKAEKGSLRGWKPRQAHRLLEKFPKLTCANLDEWRVLRSRRPDVFKRVKNPEGWLCSLLFKYGTVESAGYAGPPRVSDEAQREGALGKRAREALNEIRESQARAEPAPVGLAALFRRRKEELAK